MEKRRIYYFVLSILTVALLALMTFIRLNALGNWVDLSQYSEIIGYVTAWGPIVLLCLFAFGSLFGKLLSKIVFVLLILLLVVFTISIFAPELITNIIAPADAVIRGIGF